MIAGTPTPPAAPAQAYPGCTLPQDRCAVHPGVRWNGLGPCFVCDPAWWAERAAPVTGSAPPDGVREALAAARESGHWDWP